MGACPDELMARPAPAKNLVFLGIIYVLTSLAQFAQTFA
jgi:hypothetical protein